MTRHKILTQRPDGRADLELAAMAADQTGPYKDSRGAGISLFRTGQAAPLHEVSPDLITGREIFSAPLPAVFNPARVWESLASIQARPPLGNGLFL
jgi:hypothetical protein